MKWCEFERRDLFDSRKASCSGEGLAGTGGASNGMVKNTSDAIGRWFSFGDGSSSLSGCPIIGLLIDKSDAGDGSSDGDCGGSCS